ncbi:MAG: PAS domain S-box protein [Promethearchaeota archaeon]
MTLEPLLQRYDIPDDVKREIELTIADQRKTKRRFLKTETRLQYLLKSSPAIIYSCELRNEFPTTFISENVKKITGYDVQDFINNPSFWINHIHPDDRQKSVEHFKDIVQKEHVREIYRFQHRNGSYLWMMDEASLIRDTQGKSIEIVGYWTDITKQKEAEDKLRKSEEKYRTLFENIPIGLYRNTPGNKFLAANQTFVKQVGLSSFEELLSITPDQLATRRNYNRERFLKEINTKGKVQGLEFELKKSDGTSIYIRENARVVKDSKGVIICYEGSVEDITDRVLAEEALRESEEKYRSLIDNLSDIVTELDSEGNFTFISPQVVDILGYKPEEEIGKNGFDFIHPDDLGKALELFQKVFTGEQIYNFEYRAKHKNGHYIPVSVSGRIIEKDDEFKLISIIRDITERKKVEEALKESEEKYRLLFESAPISIGVSTIEGKPIAFNQKTSEIMGYPSDELPQVDLNDTYVDPEIRKIAIQKLLTSETIKDWEVQRKKSDGSEYYVVLNAQIVEQGGQKVILSTMQDITENKLSKEKLKRSEERYRMLFNESPISLWELDGSEVKHYIDNLISDGITDLQEYFEIHTEEVKKLLKKVKILDINSATLKLYKAKRKEDLLQDLSVVFGEESFPAFKDIILSEGKQAYEIETVNYTLKGDKIHVLVSMTIVPGYEQSFARLIVSIVDITHRIKMEIALRESEDRLRGFIDSATDSFLLLDSELNIVEVNNNLTKEWSFNREEIIGLNISDLSERAIFNSPIEYIERYTQIYDILKTEKMYDEEFKVLHPKRGERYISVRAFKVGTGLGIISRDITLQKQAEEQLQRERENLYRILNSTDDLIYIVDSQHEIQFINAAAEKEFGPLGGKKCYDYFNNFTEACSWCTMAKVISGETIRREKTLPRNQKTYDMIDTPLRNLDGSISSLAIFRDITERKQIDESLKESEHKFRTFIETLPQPVWIYQGYYCRYANPAAEQITGYSMYELSSMKFLDFLHPDYKNMAIEGGKAIETGRSPPITSAIVKIITKSEDEKWLDARLELIEFEGKRATLITAMDITERKQAEEALCESETKYRNLVERAQDGIVIVQGGKLGDNITFLNQRFAQMLGYKPEELLNKPYTQVVHPDVLPKIMERRYARLAGQEVPLIYDSKLIMKDGSSLDVGLNLGMIHYQGEEAVLAIVRDITERKQAEEQLQYQANLLKFVSDAVIASDLDFRITSWNKAAELIYGWQEEEVLGKNVGELLQQEYPYDIREDVIKDFMREGVWQGEVIQRRKDGMVINILSSVALVKDRTGKPIAALAVNRDITKRKQIEQALKENEERYRSFIENFQGIAFKGYEDYSQEFFLGKVKEITGYSEDDFFSGKLVFKDLIHPEDIQRIANDVVKFYSSSEESHRREYRIIDRYGTVHWLQEDITKFISEKENRMGVYGTIQDITKRKQAEEALRKSEVKYRLLFESAPIGIGISNLKGRVLEANQRILETMGYTSDEIKNVSLSDTYVNPEDRRKLIRILLESGYIKDFEVKLKRKDGTPYHALYNIALMELEDQKVFLTTLRDLTEWREMDKAKRDTEERLRKFMESATDGFTLLDSDLNIIDINIAGLTELGLPKEKVIGMNLLDIFPKLKGTKTYNQYIEVLKTGNPYYIDDIASAPRIRQKYYSLRAFKVGEGLGIITTDITDRVKAEKTREELEQRRDSFVWMTSHELRTPLTVLTGYCDFLVEHIDDLAQKRITNILNVMKSNLDRLERLTSKVSTIGQIERGVFEIEKTSMNLCDFLQDTLEPYHQLLGNQFEFKGCLEDQPIIVEGDPNRLQQVIDNIIGNAIKQTDKEHRKIRVISKISPSGIIIEVSDNGAGIEPDDLEVIFEQFVSIPTEFSATGTGIGLYLCRKTLEAHNGRITAQSKGPGHGATFIIELPRKKL